MMMVVETRPWDRDGWPASCWLPFLCGYVEELAKLKSSPSRECPSRFELAGMEIKMAWHWWLLVKGRDFVRVELSVQAGQGDTISDIEEEWSGEGREKTFMGNKAFRVCSATWGSDNRHRSGWFGGSGESQRVILLKLTCPAWISDCDSAIRVAIPFSLCVINGATENEAKVQRTEDVQSWLGWRRSWWWMLGERGQ